MTLRPAQGGLTPLSRELFAVTETYTYLNHAAVGVLPKPASEAVRAFVEAHATAGVMGVFPYELRMAEYRECIARFIGAQPGTIAVLRNTGDGANAIAGGFSWEPGDEVILPDNEFPANAQPWLPLRDRGVNLRFIRTARERLTPDVLRRCIGARTKVVTVSWVSFEDGYRHDLAALADVAHAHGAILAVDAIQGLGAFPIDVRACGIDALYCGGAKWMLSLQGVSFLYVAPALMDRLTVAAPGWRSVADMWSFLEYDQPLVDDASRFEGGTPNFVGALSLVKSMDVLQSAGTARIAEHVLALTGRLSDGLRSAGAESRKCTRKYRVLGHRDVRHAGRGPNRARKVAAARRHHYDVSRERHPGFPSRLQHVRRNGRGRRRRQTVRKGSCMLALILAAVMSTPAPADGTYRYVTSMNGAQVEKTQVTVKHDAAGNLLLSESATGNMNGRSGSISDTLTLDPALAPLGYSADASIADSRSMKSTLAFKGAQAVQTGDVTKTYALSADAKHFVVLDFGPFTGYFALPAQMQAWGDQPVVAIVPLYAQGVSITVDKTLAPDRPKTVPPTDAQISIKSPVQFTVWYDPKTLLVDEMDVPAEDVSVTRLP